MARADRLVLSLSGSGRLGKKKAIPVVLGTYIYFIPKCVKAHGARII
jgi:hypothetical protein